MAPAGGGNIKVVVRVRPFNGRGKLPSSTGPVCKPRTVNTYDCMVRV